VLVVAALTIGVKAFLLIQLPVAFVGGLGGIWMFYIQHQFEGTYWQRHEEWDYTTAAIRGSSYFKLPKVLQWFTGNIGFHHIHHLSSRIPNALQQCMEENRVPEQRQSPLELPNPCAEPVGRGAAPADRFPASEDGEAAARAGLSGLHQWSRAGILLQAGGGFTLPQWRSPSIAQCRSDDQIGDDLRPTLLALLLKKRQRRLDLRNSAGGHRDQHMSALPIIGSACDLHIYPCCLGISPYTVEGVWGAP
jgi:hypothetical protein